MNKEILKGRTALFILFGIILAVSIGNLIFEDVTTDSDLSLSEFVSYFLIDIVLMYLIYTGRTWAKITLSAFLVFGVLVGAIGIFLASENLLAVIQMISIILVYGYGTYFLNTNIEIKEFMNYQRNQLNIK